LLFIIGPNSVECNLGWSLRLRLSHLAFVPYKDKTNIPPMQVGYVKVLLKFS